MLRQQTDESDALPAERVRVTPEELADAIATLQAGKEDMAGTISIGDAVEELSLDATPEEILRTVESRRAHRVSSRRKKRRSWLALAAALVAVGAAGVAFRPHTQSAASVTSVTTPRTTTLADVPNEQQVFVDTHGLKQIIEGTSPAQVQTYPNSQGIRWGLIKHDGRVYVQAYTFQTSEAQIAGEAVDLYNVEDADLTGREKGYIILDSGTMYHDVKVTLPVQAFRYQNSQQLTDQAKITVTNAHPDDHLWDKFEHGR